MKRGGDSDVSTSGSVDSRLVLPLSNASNLVWKRYPGKNCWWGGNGAAREIEGEGVQAPDMSSLAGCQSSCLAALPACDAVLYSDVGGATRCYRKGGIVLAKCHPDAQLDLYRLEISPPSPPALPYPHSASTGLVAMLNAHFDLGSPAPALAENGVLIRQFDDLSAGGLNHDGNGEPWKPCPAELWCGKFHAQWPATIVNTHARHTYYPSEGGIVFNAGLVDLFCIYNECVPAARACTYASITSACVYVTAHVRVCTNACMRATLTLATHPSSLTPPLSPLTPHPHPSPLASRPTPSPTLGSPLAHPQ